MTAQLDIYFPTTAMSTEQLEKKRVKAGTQNARILEIFRDYPNILLTPFDILNIWNKRGFHPIPITSIRRSITTLTSLGYLEKTSIMQMGGYGDNNHSWRLKKF